MQSLILSVHGCIQSIFYYKLLLMLLKLIKTNYAFSNVTEKSILLPASSELLWLGYFLFRMPMLGQGDLGDNSRRTVLSQYPFKLNIKVYLERDNRKAEVANSTRSLVVRLG